MQGLQSCNEPRAWCCPDQNGGGAGALSGSGPCFRPSGHKACRSQHLHDGAMQCLIRGAGQILVQGLLGPADKFTELQEYIYLLLFFSQHFAKAVLHLRVTLPCKSASKPLPCFFKERFQCLARSLRALDFAAGKVYNMFTIPCIIWL